MRLALDSSSMPKALQIGMLYGIASVGIVLVLLFLVIVFLYQGRRRQRNAPHLTAAILLGLIGQTAAVIDVIPLTAAVFLVSLSFFFLGLHYEALASLKPTPWFFSVTLAINSAIALALCLDLLGLMISSAMAYLVIRLLTSVAALVVVLRATQIVYRIHNLAHERATRLELLGILLLTFYRVDFFVRDFGSAFGIVSPGTIESNLITTLGLVFVAVGLGVILVNYTIHPDYIYRLPFPIHSVMLYGSSGIPIYNRHVHSSTFEEKYQEVLISGALTAVSALVRETLGTGARLRHIDADMYQIFFVGLPDDRGTLVVIALGGTHFFKVSLERYASTIPSHLLGALDLVQVDPSKLQPQYDSLLLDAFPYLELRGASEV